MSPYNLLCANADIATDWDDLFVSFYTSWSNPIQPVSQLTFAHLGTNTSAERTACQKAKAELFEEVKSQSDTVFWIKCTDTSTGKIVGGMCYKHERDWPNGAAFAPTWFDKGSDMGRLSKGFYGELLRWRRMCMKGEHMYGEFAWVTPAYRNSNASQMIIDFGLKKVDGMGLEAYSEVNQFSAPVSLKSGFVIAGWTDMNFIWEKPGDEEHDVVPHEVARQVQGALQAHPIAAVWRPVGGIYVEGETILPWTGYPRRCARL